MDVVPVLLLGLAMGVGARRAGRVAAGRARARGPRWPTPPAAAADASAMLRADAAGLRAERGGLLHAARRARAHAHERAAGAAARAEADGASATRPRCASEREAHARREELLARRDAELKQAFAGALGRRAGAQQRAVRRAGRGQDQGGHGRADRQGRRRRRRPRRGDRRSCSTRWRRRCSASRGSSARSRRSASRPTRGCASRSSAMATSSEQLPRRDAVSWSTPCARRRSAAGGASCSSSASSSSPGWWSTATSPPRSSGRGEGGGVRPDMVVHLAGGKQVVVDAKVPFAAYLDAVESQRRRPPTPSGSPRTPGSCASTSTRWRPRRTGRRSSRRRSSSCCSCRATRSWRRRCRPIPALLEHAFAANVVIATPTTLIALLRTVAYGWRQEALARNAAAVHQLGRELHGRLATMGTHVAKLGRSLDGAVDSYNRTVSSLEARVLVTARKLTELQVADGELPEPGQVERAPRTVSAPELVASAEEYLIALDERGRGDDGEHGSPGYRDRVSERLPDAADSAEPAPPRRASDEGAQRRSGDRRDTPRQPGPAEAQRPALRRPPTGTPRQSAPADGAPAPGHSGGRTPPAAARPTDGRGQPPSGPRRRRQARQSGRVRARRGTGRHGRCSPEGAGHSGGTAARPTADAMRPRTRRRRRPTTAAGKRARGRGGREADPQRHRRAAGRRRPRRREVGVRRSGEARQPRRDAHRRAGAPGRPVADARALADRDGARRPPRRRRRAGGRVHRGRRGVDLLRDRHAGHGVHASATSPAACSRWPGCAAAACSGRWSRRRCCMAVAVPVVVLVAGTPRARRGHGATPAGDRRAAGQRLPDDGVDHRRSCSRSACSGWSPSASNPGRAGGRSSRGREKVSVSSAVVSSSTSVQPRSARWSSTPRTSTSGTDAPLVTPTVAHAVEPRLVDLAGVVDRCAAPAPGLQRHLDQPHRVRRVPRPDDEHEVALRRHRLHRDLPVLGGVADVVARRVLQRREAARAARRTVSIVSSTDSVVCDSQTTFSGSRTVTRRGVGRGLDELDVRRAPRPRCPRPPRGPRARPAGCRSPRGRTASPPGAPS